MTFRTLDYAVSFRVGGVWQTAIANASVLTIGGGFSVSDGTSPLSFGDGSTATCDVEILRSAMPSPWYLTPIRVSYTITVSGTPNTHRAFEGVITDYDGDMSKVRLSCESYSAVIKTARTYSPTLEKMKSRRAATTTSASSIDDPVNAGYRGGLINYLLWQAGGRPNEQSATYPSATFYYSCDTALIQIDWAWTAGDDSWSECQKAAQSSGGQVYQDELGVIRYKQPLSIVSGTSGFTFDEGVYKDVKDRGSGGQAFSSVTVSAIPRTLQPVQVVIEDKTKRLLQPGQLIELDLEPKFPIFSYQFASIETVITNLVGNPSTIATQWAYSSPTQSAQMLDVSYQNLSAEPLQIHSITVYGRPVTAGEAQVYTYGSGKPERTVGENEFIQNITHAQRIARMIHTFYATPRPVYTLEGCPYSTSRYVGEVVTFTCAALSITAQRALIVDKQHEDTAGNSTYQLCLISDLPIRTDMFQAGIVYAGATSKLLSY